MSASHWVIGLMTAGAVGYLVWSLEDLFAFMDGNDGQDGDGEGE